MSDIESPRASAPQASSTAVSTEGRRNILVELLTGFLSFLLVAVPSTIGGVFFLDPLIRGRKSRDSVEDGGLAGYIKLPVTADSIPVDGTPVAVSVRTDQDDAWNRFKDVPVGSVWLRKNPAGEIIVFNSICPHLGCSVDYRRSENDFFCPCHTSGFDLDGNKTNDIPPRDLDTLEIAAVTDGQKRVDGNELWVKFQNFRRATAEKTPI